MQFFFGRVFQHHAMRQKHAHHIVAHEFVNPSFVFFADKLGFFEKRLLNFVEIDAFAISGQHFGTGSHIRKAHAPFFCFVRYAESQNIFEFSPFPAIFLTVHIFFLSAGPA